MFKSYLKVAFRNAWRHKGYSLINILGLSIGMTLCLLILLYVQNEMSYDAFHSKADRIYRIARVEDHNDDLVPYMRIGPGTTEYLKTDFPELIEDTTRIMPTGEVWTKFGDKLFREDRFYVVDSSILEVFSFDFISGEGEGALKGPNALVLNRSTAEKYFGGTDVVGELVTVDIPGAPLLEITAVVEDLPDNSHFHPDGMVSLPTIRNEQNSRFFDQDLNSNQSWCYVLLKEGRPRDEFERRLPDFRDKNLDANLKQKIKSFYLQPLRDIHLRSSSDPFTEIEPENTGNILYLYVFSVIAVLVLLVACINFMNLATARSARRAHEVGLRKVVGAHKKQLIRQFMGESLFISVAALPAALSLSHLLIPAFNSLSGKGLGIEYLENPVVIPALLLIVLLVGFIAGSYPAFFLSSFLPVNVLKGKIHTGRSGGRLRKVLVVAQFAVSVGFMLGILVIVRQLNFMRSGDLGFSTENVVVVNCLIPEQAQQRMSKMEVLKNEFRRHPGIEDVALASGAPSEIRGIVYGRTEAMSQDDAKMMVQVAVDYEYLRTLKIDLMEGRDFSRTFSTDLRTGFIVNEAVVRELGLENPVGRTMILNNVTGTIIGVMDSIHWEPKRRVIFPMVFVVDPPRFTKMVVRIRSDDVSEALAFMEEKWKQSITTRPFQYEFLEDMIDNLYRSEGRLSRVVLYFTALSIFIACLGLFGLASFTAEQKTKEIGIRKVMGASVTGVVILLSKQFGKLILIANLIGWPLAYISLRRWLENFHYRISIGIDAFVLSAAAVLVIAFASIAYQSIKAALTDPAAAIRYE